MDLDKALRRERVGLYAFAMQGLYATGVAAVALGIARAMLSELITLASRAAGLRLADNAVMQADLARAKARLGERLPHRHAHNAEADDVAPIDVTNRARMRLACTNAIPGAVELGDFARERASTRSSRGSPFEQRFRDMHTLYQQIQARTDYFAVRAKSHTQRKSNGA